MTYKHVQVIIESLVYQQVIDEWDAINDISDYIKCREQGNEDEHYKKCVLDFKESKDGR